MTETFIEKLTSEQETLLLDYRQKWRAIAFSTERIDRQKAKEAVKAVYAAMAIKEPEIIFFDSPYAAANNIMNRSWKQRGKQVGERTRMPNKQVPETSTEEPTTNTQGSDCLGS